MTAPTREEVLEGAAGAARRRGRRILAQLRSIGARDPSEHRKEAGTGEPVTVPVPAVMAPLEALASDYGWSGLEPLVAFFRRELEGRLDLETALSEVADLVTQIPGGIDYDADPEDDSPEDLVTHIGGLIYQAVTRGLRGGPAPIQSYDLAPCMYQGIYPSDDRPDIEALEIAPGAEATHGWAYVRRDDVVALLQFMTTALNAQKEAQVALEGLIGWDPGEPSFHEIDGERPRKGQGEAPEPEPPGAQIVDLAQALKASLAATGRTK